MRFLIDANLPYRFELWRGDAYQHVFDLDDTWPDSEIWQHARAHDLVIVTKDTDFSDWIMLADSPPCVVYADREHENTRLSFILAAFMAACLQLGGIAQTGDRA